MIEVGANASNYNASFKNKSAICIDSWRGELGSGTARNRPGTERTENRKTHILGTENRTEEHVSVPVRFSGPVRVFWFYPIGTDFLKKSTQNSTFFYVCTHLCLKRK